MSKCKFDFGRFYGDGGDETIFAVNKNIYTKQQADELFVSENDLPIEKTRTYIGYVYYGIGWNDGERMDGYWINDYPKGRNPIECWAYVW